MTTDGPAQPDISVVVPVLNEADRLPLLVDMLSRQMGVSIEVMLCDGGSEDSSYDVVQGLRHQYPFPVSWSDCPRGRGRQLNFGARQSVGEFLLFLHADSRFVEQDALLCAVTSYRERRDSETPLAGRFRLQFEDAADNVTSKMSYWELKASLNRPGCTHGDQGFFMHRDIFETLGPFVEDWPIFEDTFFAEETRRVGQWMLFAATIATSARRFESEGLRQRHTLNALLMNFREIGWRSYFDQASQYYRQQADTGYLELRPFLIGIEEGLARLPVKERWRLWYRTGQYVRANAWQLFLAVKVRHAGWSRTTPVDAVEAGLLRFDRLFDRLTNHCVGHLCTAFLTWCWFVRLKRSER